MFTTCPGLYQSWSGSDVVNCICKWKQIIKGSSSLSSCVQCSRCFFYFWIKTVQYYDDTMFNINTSVAPRIVFFFSVRLGRNNMKWQYFIYICTPPKHIMLPVFYGDNLYPFNVAAFFNSFTKLFTIYQYIWCISN